MIIEDEWVDNNELIAIASSNDDYDSLRTDVPVEVSQGPIPFDQFMVSNRDIRTPTMPSATISLHIYERYTDKVLSSEFALF